MKLDMELRNTFHKSGGRITSVERIGHTCDRPENGRSRDSWYFVGNVEWRDGTKSKGIEIPPYSVCYHDEAGKPEIDDLMAFLNDYLLINGEWSCEGKHAGWYANVRPETKIKRRA